MKSRLVLTTLLLLGGSAEVAQAAEGEAWSLDDAAAVARDLLSQRTGITPDQIELKTAEAVTFPDGSAGCPRPGMNYTQALVDGYRVVLIVNGREYHYHGYRGGAPFYCAKPASKSGWIQDR